MINKIKENLNKRWNIKFFDELLNTFNSFSITEKAIFYTLTFIFCISGIILLNSASKATMVNIPASGGELTEGIIGTPRFINPVLAVSDVDQDLTQLVYSGLVKISSDNKIVPDLAEYYEISDDGLEYKFILRDNAYFHDGKKVTTDDILFTINKIQDSSIKSPLRPEFYDVQVQANSEREIIFTLKKPYSPFLGNLTVGIIPKHLWSNLSSEEFPLSQYNLQPIGSGPYKIVDTSTEQKNMLLIPIFYELKAFDKYTLGKPYISKLTINFFRDEKSMIDSYNKGDVEAISSISTDKMELIKEKSSSEIKKTALPKEFMIFFNQNESEVLTYKEVREALDLAIDKQKLVDTVLNGYGTILNGPIPSNLQDKKENLNNYDPAKAQEILEKNGWVLSSSTNVLEKKTLTLSISISTLSGSSLEKAAELIKADWEKIGVKTEVKGFDFGNLEQNIIRPRKFETLLYGLVVGRDMDLFAFWHSSQRNDPGLNIAMYTNSKVDKILEEARKTRNDSERMEKYLSFEKELLKDTPAIFLYSPEFIYITPKKINNLDISKITMPYERFLNINEWFIETNNLWKIFNH